MEQQNHSIIFHIELHMTQRHNTYTVLTILTVLRHNLTKAIAGLEHLALDYGTAEVQH